MIKIASTPVGPDSPPFIIAEMSGNHNQDLERALQIVDAAAKAGAHALKIQTYTADTMTIDLREREFSISDPASPWHGKSLYQLYQEAHTPWAWHEPIFRRCKERGMLGFSSPFDATAVDFLTDLDVPCFKIASFENVDLPLIRRVGATGKPVIVSTGLASVTEIDEAVQTLRGAGCNDIVLLKCTSTYPASPADSNLRTIADMRQRYGCEVGLSDHTLGIGAAIASVALGATVIEKHVTLRRADGGVDSMFSLEPGELASLVREARNAWQAKGRVSYGPVGAEAASLVFRRSLYVVADLRAGDVLTPQNLRAIRPGGGLPPKYLDQLLGRRVARPVRRGTGMSWDLLMEEDSLRRPPAPE
jgi:pseudaminic acid synthase